MEILSRLRPPTASLVCNSYDRLYPSRSHVSDLQPASGFSETLGRQTPVHRRQNHLQYKEPGPLSGLVRKMFPTLHEKLWQTVTEPRTATLLPDDQGGTPQSSHDSTTVVPYLTFPTVVGKNSAFQNLTQEQLEELGGIEFRALNMLMWAVPLVRRVCPPRDISDPGPISVLFLLVGDPFYCPGPVHVTTSLGKHFSDTQPASEHIPCLVSGI